MGGHARIQTLLHRKESDMKTGRKFWLTIAGLAMIGLAGVGFYLKNQFDTGLWMLVLGAIPGIVGVHAAANVVAKKGEQK